MKSARTFAWVAAAMVVSGYWLLTPGSAQQPPAELACTVGVVDVPEVFRASKEIDDLKKRFEAEKDQLKAEAARRDKKIKELRAQLEKFLPNSPDFKAKSEELLHLAIEFRTWAEESQKGLEMRHRRFTEQFYGKVMAAVKRLAETHRLHVVLYKEEYEMAADSADELLAKIRERKVLYTTPRANLTPEVIKQINDEYAPLARP